ncbi:glyoxalase/Bleomycin resistance protein/Dioxygenase superfamily protein [bacterium BMS3Abin02]|nr:glyoxalase/Bleomycin resistance protein/Dioxygenase superfamily protein [bacterium BMS3Abin02]GBE20978.1 glyoxalase/Bleomycin resistance protein/Dioxygenase superfamily protein [bacterium BMS3Bbin01]HDH26150.1 methylmalonyl-CoA epimerase [Actinomycetota bacterium]HDK46109.1 methylmalonyl-CoA epimerase [Actinomycetota bacterium]
MKAFNLDHVAIAVDDLDASLAEFKDLLGIEPLSREAVSEQGVEEAMLPVGGSYVQLLAPLSSSSPVGKFLAKRGQGLHHIAITVTSIDDALDHLKARGARLVDEEARSGGGGHRIAFVHPATLAGTLIELVELDGD